MIRSRLNLNAKYIRLNKKRRKKKHGMCQYLCKCVSDFYMPFAKRATDNMTHIKIVRNVIQKLSLTMTIAITIIMIIALEK